MRKIIRYLLLSALTALMMSITFILSGCAMSQVQSTHVCSYTEFSPTALSHMNSDELHDFLKMFTPAIPEQKDSNGKITQEAVEGGLWAKNYTAETPFVGAYYMTYDLELTQTVTLGENVYIAICTHSAFLKFNGGKVIVPENSGFFLYDCAVHGCYAGMEIAKGISKAYLDFAYHYNNQSTYILPSGNYALNEPLSLMEYIDAEKIAFANASNTSICLNNFAQGIESEKEISQLRSLGVRRVYRACDEFDAIYQKHTCVYIQDEMNSIPLNQANFNDILPSLAQMKVSTENPLANYTFIHLTGDVAYTGDAVLQLPQGIKIGVCRNGFQFDVPEIEGVYVFDCKEHICVNETLNNMTPIWKDGLDIMSSYLADVHDINPSYPAEIVLGAGKYALMDDFALGEFPSSITFNENVQLCRNGHTVAENDNAYEEGYTWDCKVTVDETMHKCDKLPFSDSIITLNYETAEAVLTSGVLTTQGDVMVVLDEDMEVPGTLVVPQGTSLYVCLNGHNLVAAKSLHESNTPYMFFVEFGASLTIVNCASTKTSGLYALTEAMLTAEEKAYNDNCTTILNMGTCVVDNVVMLGGYGVRNEGYFTANNCMIGGVFAGAYSAEANENEFPLHSKNTNIKLNNCSVVSLMCGVLTLGGDTELNSSTVNSALVGVVHTDASILENGEIKAGSLTLNDVEISISLDMLEGYDNPEISASVKELLEGGLIGVISTGDIKLESDLTIDVDPALLEPYEKENGELVIPQSVDFLLMECQLDIADGVELTEQYTVYCPMENGGSTVIANKDISEQLLLLGGMASVVNNKGEMVVVAGEEALFMKNAVVYNASIGMEGYLRLDIYFTFDTVAEYLFIPNQESRVMVTIGGETEELTPGSLRTDNGYVYTIDLYAMDYSKTVNVQFTNGEYTWTGIADISIEKILINVMAEIDLDVEDVQTALNGGNLTTEEVVTMEEKLTQAYALKNAIIAMLNYCDLAAVQFGTQDYHRESNELFTFISNKTVTDETTGESTVVKETMQFTVAQATEYVSAETLEEYKFKLAENALLPNGVTFLGASLVLTSGLDIRFYFRLEEGRSLDSLSFMVDGEVVTPVLYKNLANTYYLAIDEISAFEITHMFNVVIQEADMQAENRCVYSFDYGTLSYMYNVLANEGSTETLKTLAKATYIYAKMMEFAAETLGTTESTESTESTVATVPNDTLESEAV